MNDNLFSLAGKVALVTGAGSGLGAHFARTLGKAGAKVVCAARRRELIDAVAGEINQAGGEAIAVAMDVTDRASVKACYDETEKQLGLVDVIVNNAGFSIMVSCSEMSEEDWDAVLDTNLKGTWHVSQEGTQRLLAANATGSIINISSSLGTQVKKTMTNYCTSKAAINQFSKTLALELADKGIRVNAIAPGIFATEMTEDWFDTEDGLKTIATLPCGRPGNLSELDGLLLLLASDASTYISGAVITIDAAHSIGWPDPGN